MKVSQSLSLELHASARIIRTSLYTHLQSAFLYSFYLNCFANKMLLLIARNYLYIYLYFTLLFEEILMRRPTDQKIFFNKREMVSHLNIVNAYRIDSVYRLSLVLNSRVTFQRKDFVSHRLNLFNYLLSGRI